MAQINSNEIRIKIVTHTRTTVDILVHTHTDRTSAHMCVSVYTCVGHVRIHIYYTHVVPM